MGKMNLELTIATCVENNNGTTDKNLVMLNVSSEDGQVRVEPGKVIDPSYQISQNQQNQLNSAPKVPLLTANNSNNSLEVRSSADMTPEFIPWSQTMSQDEIDALPSAEEYLRSTGSNPELLALLDSRRKSQHKSQPRDRYGRFVSANRNIPYVNPERTGLEHLDEVDMLEIELDARDQMKKNNPAHYEKGVMPKYPVYLALGAVTLAALAFAYERVSTTNNAGMTGNPIEQTTISRPETPVQDVTASREIYTCTGENYIAVSRKLTGTARYAKQIISYNKQHNPVFDYHSKRCRGNILVPPDMPRNVRKAGRRGYHPLGRRNQ